MSGPFASSVRDSMQDAQSPIGFLRSPATIRARAEEMYELAGRGALEHFELRPERIVAVAERTLRITRARFPDFAIPHHGRIGHLRAGGIDRVQAFEALLEKLPGDERGRARVAWIVVSVLLDAGAGPTWAFTEPGAGFRAGRSEGLAVAAHHFFLSGALSSDPAQPLRADAERLAALEGRRLASAFQAGPKNPMVGLDGRAELLASLGSAIRAAPHLFGGMPTLGGLFDTLASRAEQGLLPARRLLHTLLEALGPIWPGRVTVMGVNMGDVWPHSKIGGTAPTAGLVPFHKLSQWLAYSLVEPLERSGVRVIGVDELTGLAEYRNGGLFVDEGVLVPKHDGVLRDVHEVGSEVVVEWRALTVALLDRVAAEVRAAAQLDASRLPVSRVLEGGTWLAGREIAAEKRPGGGPPIRVASDGTVF
jgi:hypothetical protein